MFVYYLFLNCVSVTEKQLITVHSRFRMQYICCFDFILNNITFTCVDSLNTRP